MWKTLWKLWITLCRAFPVQALCCFLSIPSFYTKVMESADFDKTPVLPGGGSSPSNSLPPEISVSFRETFCIPAVMNTPRISRRIGKFMVDGRQKTWYNTACDFPRRPYACVAQLVEQLTRNEQVAGSSPATSSKRTPLSARTKGFFIIAPYSALQTSTAGNRSQG